MYFAMTVAIVSCTQFIPEQEFVKKKNPNNVSINEIRALADFFSSPTKSVDYTIEPITAAEDTLLYLVHHSAGWHLFSADKRTPLVLAYGKGEPLSTKQSDESSNIKLWLDHLVASLKAFRESPENASLPQIDYWAALSDIESTKTDGEPLPGWRLVAVTRQNDYIHNIPHLTTTQWGQVEPWNSCMPYLHDASSLRAANGCVNIAFAQMIFWGNERFGVPVYAYTEATCHGSIPNHSRSFSDSTDTAWALMRKYQNGAGNAEYPGYLMGKIATLHPVYYNWYVNSQGDTLRMTVAGLGYHTTIGDYFGFSCTPAAYSPGIVISNLLEGKPVIIGASGHAWIIDGYQNVQTTTRFHYIYDPHNSYQNEVIHIEDEEEPGSEWYIGGHDFTPPEGYEYRYFENLSNAHFFQMNWGENGEGNGGYYDAYSTLWFQTPTSSCSTANAEILYNFSFNVN